MTSPDNRLSAAERMRAAMMIGHEPSLDEVVAACEAHARAAVEAVTAERDELLGVLAAAEHIVEDVTRERDEARARAKAQKYARSQLRKARSELDTLLMQQRVLDVAKYPLGYVREYIMRALANVECDATAPAEGAETGDAGGTNEE